MDTTATIAPYESASGGLYDPGMAKVQRLSVENARKTLGDVLKKAADEQTHTVVARHGTDMGVVVPMKDYRRYRELDGDPTEL